MKIAIISKFDYHYECLGFLCEILKEHSISIYFRGDQYKYIDFFKNFYSNIAEVLPVELMNETVFSTYDRTIKLSANDTIFSHSKVISIVHLLPYTDNISKKHISLTNYITGDNITVMFPVYNVNNTMPCYTNTAIFIGYYRDSWCDDDFNSFIKNSKFKFNFVIYGDDNYPKLSSYSNVSIMHKLPMNILSEMIYNSKFILARKPQYINKDRFCGCFTLAMSFNKPLIVDEQTQSIYKFPGVIFKNGYSEITDTINTMSDCEYDGLLNEVSNFRNNAINENKIKMDELLLSE